MHKRHQIFAPLMRFSPWATNAADTIKVRQTDALSIILCKTGASCECGRALHVVRRTRSQWSTQLTSDSASITHDASRSSESNYRLPITPFSFIQFLIFSVQINKRRRRRVRSFLHRWFSRGQICALICRPITPAGRERESSFFFVLTGVQIRRIPHAARWLRHPGLGMRRTRHPSKSAGPRHPTRTKIQSVLRNYSSTVNLNFILLHLTDMATSNKL